MNLLRDILIDRKNNIRQMYEAKKDVPFRGN